MKRKPYVLIRVFRGCADVVSRSRGIDVEILDIDCLEDRSPETVRLSKRMWAHLKKHFPKEYERLKKAQE